MEAATAAEIPAEPEWQYEPKWDGFRCLVFRNGPHVELQSKSQQSLTRFFPELAEAASSLPARRFVLDGEIVIPDGSGLSFDALLQRLHPAESRIRTLSEATPASLLVFDLLVDERGNDITGQPLSERRKALEHFAKNFPSGSAFQLSPTTRSLPVARQWLSGSGPATDGVMAKQLHAPYDAGSRGAVIKIKRIRTAECVVGGFRYTAGKHQVGSLLLGLYDRDGLLHHVGFTSGIPWEERETLTRRLQRLVRPPGFTGKSPGGPSRWNHGKENEWHPVGPELVVEVTYDHVTSNRFRHGTRFLRWRPDKAPAQCSLQQLLRRPASIPRRRAPSEKT